MATNSDMQLIQHSQGASHVVFIHGYGEVADMWTQTIEFLKNQDFDYSIYSLNLPGFGKSPLTENIESLQDVGNVIADSLGFEGIDKATFVGHSLGGYVLMHLIAFHPEIVDRACFMNSSVFADTEIKKVQRNKVIDFLQTNGTAAFIENFIPGLFYIENREACAEHITKAIEQGKTISSKTMIRYMEMMRDRQDLSHSLTHFEKPVHFIIGKNDESVTFETSSPQISIPPFATALILDNCGHMAMFEKKEATLSSVCSFLNC